MTVDLTEWRHLSGLDEASFDRARLARGAKAGDAEATRLLRQLKQRSGELPPPVGPDFEARAPIPSFEEVRQVMHRQTFYDGLTPNHEQYQRALVRLQSTFRTSSGFAFEGRTPESLALSILNTMRHKSMSFEDVMANSVRRMTPPQVDVLLDQYHASLNAYSYDRRRQSMTTEGVMGAVETAVLEAMLQWWMGSPITWPFYRTIPSSNSPFLRWRHAVIPYITWVVSRAEAVLQRRGEL